MTISYQQMMANPRQYPRNFWEGYTDAMEANEWGWENETPLQDNPNYVRGFNEYRKWYAEQEHPYMQDYRAVVDNDELMDNGFHPEIDAVNAAPEWKNY